MNDILILSPAKRKRIHLLSSSKKTNASDRPNSTQLDAASPKILHTYHDEFPTYLNGSTDDTDLNGRETNDILDYLIGEKEIANTRYKSGHYEDSNGQYLKSLNFGVKVSLSPSSTSYNHSQNHTGNSSNDNSPTRLFTKLAMNRVENDSNCNSIKNVKADINFNRNKNDDNDSNDVIVYINYENDSNHYGINENDGIMEEKSASLQIEAESCRDKDKIKGKFTSKKSEFPLFRNKKKESYKDSIDHVHVSTSLLKVNELDNHNDDLYVHNDRSNSSATFSTSTQRRSFTCSGSDKIRSPPEDCITSCDNDSDDEKIFPIRNWQNWRNSTNSSIDVEDQGVMSDSNDVAGHLSCLHMNKTRTVLGTANEFLNEESDSVSLRSFVSGENEVSSRRERLDVHDSSASFVDALITSLSPSEEERERERGSESFPPKYLRRNDNSKTFKMLDNENQNGQIINNGNERKHFSPSSSSYSAPEPPSSSKSPLQYTNTELSPRIIRDSLPSQFVFSACTTNPRTPPPSQGSRSMTAADYMGDLGTPVCP